MSAESVLNHHLESFGAGNLEELLKDYTDESVLVSPEETLRGRDAIAGLFSGWFETVFKPGTYTFTMDRVDIEGDFAYIVWHAECEGVRFLMGTDTFFVKDGKIAYQTLAAYAQ